MVVKSLKLFKSRFINPRYWGSWVYKTMLKGSECLKQQQHDNYFLRRLVRTKVLGDNFKASLTLVRLINFR